MMNLKNMACIYNFLHLDGSECTEPSSERTKMHCGDKIDKKVWVISKDKEGCVAIYVDCNVFDGDLFETRSECISTCFPDAIDVEKIRKIR